MSRSPEGQTAWAVAFLGLIGATVLALGFAIVVGLAALVRWWLS